MKAYDSILMVAAAVAMSLAPGLASSAAGDSIYLKNGRVIRSDDITVDGDRLVFYQHGGHQAIPMSLVDRIEADDWPAPGSEPRRPLPQENAAPLLDAPPDGRAPPGGSAAALQALSGMLGSGEGGIDMAQALQLLQGLGTQSSGAKAAGGLEALMPLLGMLGGNSNAPGLAELGGLGGLGGLGEVAGHSADSGAGESEFFCGDQLTRADLALVIHLMGGSILACPPEGQRLAAWFERVSERPAVKRANAEFLEAMTNSGKDDDPFFGREHLHVRDHRLEWCFRLGLGSWLAQELEAGRLAFSPVP